VNLVRSCDDCMITGSSKEWLETEVKPLVEAFLPERGLGLSPEKTRITQIEDGFDFLGQQIRRARDGKILITPSKKTVETV
jgi:RNA-directed DNA polymerase